MTTDIKELVKRLRDGDCLDIGAAADALEALARELYDARVVCGDTFDSARKWRAQAEAAIAERDRLKEALLDIKHFGAGFAQDRARKALGGDAS